MKAIIFIVPFAIAYLSLLNVPETTDAEYQLHNTSIQFRNGGPASIDLDSIIKKIIFRDTIPNTIALFYIDFLGKSGKGCIINKNGKNYEGKIFEIENAKITESVIEEGQFNSVKHVLDCVFQRPNEYVLNFFPNKKLYLSHDNTLFLYIRRNSETIFDEKFMRSSFVGTTNKKSMQLVRELNSLL